MGLIATHTANRGLLLLAGSAVGVLIGVGNIFLDLDFSPRWELLAWLGAALGIVALLHEGLHGLAGVAFGLRPRFGFKPPFLYTTFENRVSRGRFIAIALAPLVVLDASFVALYFTTDLQLLWNLCFTVNTIGAAGDVWIVLVLLRHPRGSMVQDTMTGVEVWRG